MTQSVIYVPVSKLSIAPTNVRSTSDAAADAQLKASIAARGILQNLVGVPVPRRKGEYQITAGGRRLTQLQALITEGVFAADHQVPLLVLGDRQDAAEVSLSENFDRLNMTPTDECRAFQHIITTEKKLPADVAKRFGLTERFVLGRLRLADLAEPIFTALGEGQITLDVAKAYASVADTDRQAEIFAQMGDGYYATSIPEIRRRLASGYHRGSDPKALLIGRDAYLAAGGRIDSDLFSDSGNESWIDGDIVNRLASERMQAAAEALGASEGYGEVRFVCDSRVPYMEACDLEEIEGDAPPLTREQEDRQREIEAELEGLAENAGDDGYSDADAETVQALEAEYAAITEPIPVISEAQKASALAYLVIGHDGQPRLHDQLYLVPEPATEEEQDSDDSDDETGDAQETDGDDGGAADVDIPSGPKISQRLADELAMMKVELLRVHVASDPHFALDLGTFFMVDSAHRYRFDMPSELRAPTPSPRVAGFVSDTPAAASWSGLEAGLNHSWTWHDSITGRYDGFCAMEEADRAAWLGWAVARTLQAVPAGASGSAMLDHLGQKLGIDVAAWWRPTARTYFDRVSKPTILDHFEAVGGAELKSRYSESKKHDLALSAEKLFSGQIIVETEIRDRAIAWLPDAMRFGIAAPAEEIGAPDDDADGAAGANAAGADAAADSAADISGPDEDHPDPDAERLPQAA